MDLVISGARAFQFLTPEEQEFALNTTVQYAPRAYEWIRDCKATSDGLGIAHVGDERPAADLPPWEWNKVHAFPVLSPLLVSHSSLANVLSLDGLEKPRHFQSSSPDSWLLRTVSPDQRPCDRNHHYHRRSR